MIERLYYDVRVKCEHGTYVSIVAAGNKKGPVATHDGREMDCLTYDP